MVINLYRICINISLLIFLYCWTWNCPLSWPNFTSKSVGELLENVGINSGNKQTQQLDKRIIVWFIMNKRQFLDFKVFITNVAASSYSAALFNHKKEAQKPISRSSFLDHITLRIIRKKVCFADLFLNPISVFSLLLHFYFFS